MPDTITRAEEAAAVAALNQEMAESITDGELSADSDLQDITSTAEVNTHADAFDITAAAELADDVNADDAEALRKELADCGSKFRGVRNAEAKGREALHRAIAQGYAASVGAFQKPEVLVAIAKRNKIPATKASWKNPSLIIMKVMDSKMDDKTASLYGRAINCLAANKVPPDKAEAVIARHGVVALAKQEAERQKLRRGGGSGKPPPEDPVAALRREASAVPLPAAFEIGGLPKKDGEAALLVIGRQEGKLIAWAVDADEKSTAAAARRVLKQIRTAGTAKQEDPEAD